MAARLSLHEYQRNLSARLVGAAGGQAVTKLGIRAGHSRWLIDLVDAGEVLPVPAITRVPLTRPWYAGVANIRGNLYSVIDFPALLGGAPLTAAYDTRLVLIGTKYRFNSSLLVDGVLGLYREDQLTPGGKQTHTRWTSVVYTDAQGEQWNQLNVRELIAHPEFLQVGA
jgi:twitching motility protein PilI